MPASALSRVGARVVESCPGGGQVLAEGTWQKLEALPDPRSPRGRVYPLACLVAIALCAFTAAGNDRLTAVGQWISRAGQADLARLRVPWDRSPAGTGSRMRRRSEWCWTAWTRGRWPGPWWGLARPAQPGRRRRPACAATGPGAPLSRHERWPAAGYRAWPWTARPPRGARRADGTRVHLLGVAEHGGHLLDHL